MTMDPMGMEPEVQEPEEQEEHVVQVHQKESGVRALDMGFRQGQVESTFIYDWSTKTPLISVHNIRDKG